jgi:transcriptional regulator with XRE-family HTH domain
MSEQNTFASDPDLQRQLGERLRAHRIQQELSVEALAGQAGVTPLTVLKAEGGANITLRTLLRILRALGMVDQITALVPPPAPSPMALLDEKPTRPRQRVRKRQGG